MKWETLQVAYEPLKQSLRVTRIQCCLW